MSEKKYEAIVIGASAGSVDALSRILPALPADFPLPIMIVVHVPPHKDSILAELLGAKCKLKVCNAEDKEPLLSGCVYFAPADYHMLVEHEDCLSLSNEEEVLFSRPSIDVLFQSAADVYGDSLIGIILTGANNDGADGLAAICKAGGLALVQNPQNAYAAIMPEAAIKTCPEARIVNLEDIPEVLLDLSSAS